jgi:tight adherence protein C
MELAIVAFGVMFLLIASGGLILFYREAMMKRIFSAIEEPHTAQRQGFVKTLQESGFSLSAVVDQFERVLPKSQEEVGITQQRLIRAGFRSDSAVKTFYGAKVMVPILLVAGVLASGLVKGNPLFICLMALGVGFLVPDFWLGHRISSRQTRIRMGLPDVLDLLVICIEAGLGLDQATARTAKELHLSQPDISDELGIVVLEQRAGRPRQDAWKHMAERTDLDVVRALVNMLVQSEQFGTSVAKTLRTHADTLRTQRVQAVEEKAAKTSVKLIFPLVLFIFPCLFIVTVGPAMIQMAESFSKNFN